jgi:MFS-type transporter involved in bile tolerance (Atg22 family)
LGRRISSARSLALDTSPLRDSPAFRALWLSQMVSMAGTQMRIVAVAWQVFQITGSNVAVGLIGLVEVVPLVIFSILGGAMADRTDRRRLVARMQGGLMLSSLALAWLAFDADPSLIGIFALTAVSSAFSAVDRPARTAMLPSLVAPEQLSAALALRQVLFQTTQIVGPALGGLLIGAFSEIAFVYLIDALTFVVALVALKWVPSAPPETDENVSHLESIKEGLRFSFKTPLILSIFLIDLVAMIFGMPRAVFPSLAERTFGIGAEGVGLLYAAPSAGALAAALSSGWVGRVRRQGLAVLVAVTGWGLAVTVAGIATVFSLWATLFLLALAGAADVVSAIFRGTMLQQATPDGLRGRVSAVNLMVVTGGPRLGDLEAGLVAGAVGAPASIVIGGLACLMGTVAVGGAFPSLRRQRVLRASDDK